MPLNSQVGLLDKRVAKIQREIAAHRAEQKADRRQLVLIEEEIAAVRVLLEKGWSANACWPCNVSKPVWRRVGNRVALIARAEQAISEIEFQTASFTENTEAEVETNRVKRASKSPRLVSVCAVPASAWSGLGARARRRPGLWIAVSHYWRCNPAKRGYSWNRASESKAECRGAHDPKDIDVVKIGALTTVRLTSFSQRTFKPVDGELIRISADIVNDGRSPPYYVGEIVLDPERLAQQADLELIQGMPAMAIISTGDQTMLDYIIAPIARSVEFSLREN